MIVQNATTERDFGEIVRELRHSLSGGTKPITQEQLSQLLGVSWSTVARWEGGQSPDKPTQLKLARLVSALELMGDMVHPDDRLVFFEARNPLLLNLRPIDLLASDEGLEAITRLLEGAASGSFA